MQDRKWQRGLIGKYQRSQTTLLSRLVTANVPQGRLLKRIWWRSGLGPPRRGPFFIVGVGNPRKASVVLVGRIRLLNLSAAKCELKKALKELYINPKHFNLKRGHTYVSIGSPRR